MHSQDPFFTQLEPLPARPDEMPRGPASHEMGMKAEKQQQKQRKQQQQQQQQVGSTVLGPYPLCPAVLALRAVSPLQAVSLKAFRLAIIRIGKGIFQCRVAAYGMHHATFLSWLLPRSNVHGHSIEALQTSYLSVSGPMTPNPQP